MLSNGKSKSARKPAKQGKAAERVPRGTRSDAAPAAGGERGKASPKQYGAGPKRLATKGEHIEVIARGCLLHGSRVLLCRNLKHGYAYLPGGHVEFTESAARALAREFLEECGVPVQVGQFALVTEGAFTTKKRWHHEINLVFHVERAGAWPDAASGKGAGKSERNAGGDGGMTRRHDSLPRVQSQEDQIAFEWVDLAAVPETDIRPESVKAWLAALGHADGGAIEWVSEIVA